MINKNKKLFIVVNVDWFFLSHRLPIALAAKEEGYDVTIVAFDTGKKDEIISHGLHFIDIPFKRSGYNVFHELKCVFLLAHLYRKYKPDVIHQVTLKVCLLGCLASKISGTKNVINAICGFGYNFTSGRKSLLQLIVRYAIKFVFKSKSFFFILQNQDDITMLKNFSFINSDNIILIKGSGVDLNKWTFSSEPSAERIKILFPARVLYDKGIMEFLQAAKSCRSAYRNRALFIIAGDCDTENLACMPESELKQLLEEDYIVWLGFQKNIFKIMTDSNIIVLPSYREGMPKALMEACAVGRPIVTTNAIGCKECVIDGENGFLVSVKQYESLADKIRLLIDDKKLRTEMGVKGRSLAEKEFSIDFVVMKTLNLYGRVLTTAK